MLTFCLKDLSVKEVLNSPTIIMLLQISPIGPANNFFTYFGFPMFSSVVQSCPTLCDPMDCSMPGLPVHHQFLELIFFAFSYCSWGSQGKNSAVVCHSLLQWTVFCQNSTMTCLSWVALQGMAHSCIELDKAVIHVISLVSFL